MWQYSKFKTHVRYFRRNKLTVDTFVDVRACGISDLHLRFGIQAVAAVRQRGVHALHVVLSWTNFAFVSTLIDICGNFQRTHWSKDNATRSTVANYFGNSGIYVIPTLFRRNAAFFKTVTPEIRTLTFAPPITEGGPSRAQTSGLPFHNCAFGGTTRIVLRAGRHRWKNKNTENFLVVVLYIRWIQSVI